MWVYLKLVKRWERLNQLVLTALAGPQKRPPALMRRHSPSGERGFFIFFSSIETSRDALCLFRS